MLEFILLALVFLLLGMLVVVSIDTHKQSETLETKNRNFEIYTPGMNPNKQPFPIVNDCNTFGKKCDDTVKICPTIIPTVPLSQEMEKLAENGLVDFGPYLFGIYNSYLAIVDSEGGKHRMFLGDNIRITYADIMVLYIETKTTKVVIAKGSPFISVQNPKAYIETDQGNLKPQWRNGPNGYRNCSILPQNKQLEQLLSLNSDVLLISAHIRAKKIELIWSKNGTGHILMLIPAHLSPVASLTGVFLDTPRGKFRLERGSVWNYSLRSFQPIKNDQKASKLENIVYDCVGKKLIDKEDPQNSVLKIIQWLNENSHMRIDSYNYAIVRSNFCILQKENKFVCWNSVDFYYRTFPIINLENIPNVEILHKLYELLSH
jgi:hypothetical protein